MRMHTSALALAFAACVVHPLSAQAQNAQAHKQTRAEALKAAESAMQLHGSIVIARDGSVAEYAIDKAEVLSAPVAAVLDKTIRQWRFQPVQVDGQVVQAKAPMSLRLVAKPIEEGKVALRVGSVHFHGQSRAKDQPPAQTGERVALASNKRVNPDYPSGLMRAGAGGTVYSVLRVGRDGKVLDTHIEQVNLDFVADARSMAVARDAMAKSVRQATKHWTFLTPNAGNDKDAPYWSVRVPVSYCAADRPCAGGTYGRWLPYVPGPRELPPAWASEALKTAGAPDALPGGGIHPLDGDAPRLLTPLGG